MNTIDYVRVEENLNIMYHVYPWLFNLELSRP